MKPELLKDLTAESLPGPGPLTKISKLFNPNSAAFCPALSAATCAANGVLFLEPRNPEPPEVAQERDVNGVYRRTWEAATYQPPEPADSIVDTSLHGVEECLDQILSDAGITKIE